MEKFEGIMNALLGFIASNNIGVVVTKNENIIILKGCSEPDRMSVGRLRWI